MVSHWASCPLGSNMSCSLRCTGGVPAPSRRAMPCLALPYPVRPCVGVEGSNLDACRSPANPLPRRAQPDPAAAEHFPAEPHRAVPCPVRRRPRLERGVHSIRPLPSPAMPRRALPYWASPRQRAPGTRTRVATVHPPCLALPGLATPWLAQPSHAAPIPALPCRTQPRSVGTFGSRTRVRPSAPPPATPCTAMPSPTQRRRTQPCVGAGASNPGGCQSPAVPCLAWPCQAEPCLATPGRAALSRARPCVDGAESNRAEDRPPIPYSLPCPAVPSCALPGLALPRGALPGLAAPYLAMPCPASNVYSRSTSAANRPYSIR